MTPEAIPPTVTEPHRVVADAGSVAIPRQWLTWGLYSAVVFLLGGAGGSLLGDADATLSRRVDTVETQVVGLAGKLEASQALAAAAKQSADDSRERLARLEVRAEALEVAGSERDRLILKTLGVTALALTEINVRLSGIEGRRPDEALSPELARRVNDLNLQYQLLETRVDSRR